MRLAHLESSGRKSDIAPSCLTDLSKQGTAEQPVHKQLSVTPEKY